jgi:hypothetical protein
MRFAFSRTTASQSDDGAPAPRWWPAIAAEEAITTSNLAIALIA